jgi:hypothetical protein
VGSSDAARKSYERYVSIRGQADPGDRLQADAGRRAAQ